MARKGRVDPARDLLDLMGQHAQDSSKQVLPQLDTGTVIMINDAADGTVVQLDNMQVAASDCNLLGTHAPVVGDRVMVLVHMEEFWILGGIKGEATGSSSGPPSGAAGGDLAGTYPSPTVKASVGLTGAPTAATATLGTNTTQLASTAFVQAAITALTASLTSSLTTALDPPGVIKMYGGASVPTGWLFCNGAAVSRTGANAALFAAVSTTFGVGDGSTTFNLPDFRGRVPIGPVTAGDITAVVGLAADATVHGVGVGTGTEGTTLGITQIPAHSHTGVTGTPSTNTTAGPSINSTGFMQDTGTTNNSNPQLPNAGTAGTVANPGSVSIGFQWGSSISAGVTGYSGTAINHAHAFTTDGHVHDLSSHTHTMGNHTHTITAEGGGLAHTNMQPFTTVNYIIKL